MISQILHFFQKGVWELRLKELPPVKVFLIRCLRVALLALQRFMKNDGQKSAAVLTYYSLLNLVPLVAVAFAIAKGFSLEKLVQTQIMKLAQEANWQSDITDQILGFSQSLLEHAKGGVIAGVGIAVLFYTVISIFGKIEDSFNAIWEVEKPRTLVRKFTDYLTVMVLTPILFIISSSVTVMVVSQVEVIVRRIALLGAISSIIFFGLKLLPYLSIWVLFMVLYLVMPHTRVPLRSGIAGGLVAGTIFVVVQWVYIRFQIGVSSYGAIYGSFAAVPLFLVWLQLSWTIVLFGCEISHACGHYETFGFHPDYSRISEHSKRMLVLRVFHLLVKRFSMGETALTTKQIAHTLEIPIRLVERLLSELIEVNLAVETTAGSSHEIGFQPGRTITRSSMPTKSAVRPGFHRPPRRKQKRSQDPCRRSGRQSINYLPISK